MRNLIKILLITYLSESLKPLSIHEKGHQLDNNTDSKSLQTPKNKKPRNLSVVQNAIDVTSSILMSGFHYLTVRGLGLKFEKIKEELMVERDEFLGQRADTKSILRNFEDEMYKAESILDKVNVDLYKKILMVRTGIDKVDNVDEELMKEEKEEVEHGDGD